MLKRVALLLLAVAAIAYFSWTVVSTSTFQNCISNNSEAGHYAANNQPPIYALAFAYNTVLYGRCVGHVIYIFRDAITAIATVFIASFTITLWWSIRRLSEDSLKQIALARHELAMVHGPKLAITRITEIILVSGDPMSAVIDIVNYGGSDATVTASGGDIFIRPKNNYRPVTFDANLTDTTSVQILLPGKGYRFRVTSLQIPSQQDLSNVRDGTVDVCLVGHINYTDGSGVLKLINYFRVFDYKLGCFRRPETAAERREWEYPN
jgi:hypothetical protein